MVFIAWACVPAYLSVYLKGQRRAPLAFTLIYVITLAFRQGVLSVRGYFYLLQRGKLAISIIDIYTSGLPAWCEKNVIENQLKFKCQILIPSCKQEIHLWLAAGYREKKCAHATNQIAGNKKKWHIRIEVIFCFPGLEKNNWIMGIRHLYWCIHTKD